MSQFETLPSLPLARRWRQQAHPVASVLALIQRDGSSERDETAPLFLLIRRQTEPYRGKWGLVGGRWEFGETLETAVTREVKEETGVDATFVALRALVNERIAPSSSSDDGAHFLLFVCEVSTPVGTAREQSEGPVAWFSQEDLIELNRSNQIVSSDYAILQRFNHATPVLPFIEAEVMTGHGANASGEILHLTPVP